jgi:hypothetical protein
MLRWVSNPHAKDTSGSAKSAIIVINSGIEINLLHFRLKTRGMYRIKIVL